MKQSKPNLIKEAASSVRLDGETRDEGDKPQLVGVMMDIDIKQKPAAKPEGDKPEDTERLDVIKKILDAADVVLEKRGLYYVQEGYCRKSQADKAALVILSRRDSLMKKRGAVEELRNLLNGSVGKYEIFACGRRTCNWRITELELEIREMEGSK